VDAVKKYRKRLKRGNVLALFLVFILFLGTSAWPVLASSASPNDICLIPDHSATVVIDECNTGVRNVKDGAGCTIWLRVMQCAGDVKNHGDFVRCVSRLTNRLNKSGVISGKEKGKIESCAAKADFPCSECEGIGVTTQGPGFGFETASDSLSLALATVYDAYILAPRPDVDMDALGKLRDEAIQHLQAHPEEAAAALVTEASRLNSLDQGSMMAILHLISRFESNTGIRFLFGRVMNPTPPNCSAGGAGEVLCGTAVTLRMAAIGSLGHISTLGSLDARARLLDLVGHEDTSVQRQAIAVFYESAGMSRWRAKRLMSERLPASKRYLLHEIY
jgi:hypothetical protein